MRDLSNLPKTFVNACRCGPYLERCLTQTLVTLKLKYYLVLGNEQTANASSLPLTMTVEAIMMAVLLVVMTEALHFVVAM